MSLFSAHTDRVPLALAIDDSDVSAAASTNGKTDLLLTLANRNAARANVQTVELVGLAKCAAGCAGSGVMLVPADVPLTPQTQYTSTPFSVNIGPAGNFSVSLPAYAIMQLRV